MTTLNTTLWWHDSRRKRSSWWWGWNIRRCESAEEPRGEIYLYFNTVFVDQQVCNHPGARRQTFVTLGTLKKVCSCFKEPQDRAERYDSCVIQRNYWESKVGFDLESKIIEAIYAKSASEGLFFCFHEVDGAIAPWCLSPDVSVLF